MEEVSFDLVSLLVDVDLFVPGTAYEDAIGIQTLVGLYSYSKQTLEPINEYVAISNTPPSAFGTAVKATVHFKGVNHDRLPTALTGNKWGETDLSIVIRILYVDEDGCDVLALGAMPLVTHIIVSGKPVHLPVSLYSSPEGYHLSDWVVHKLCEGKADQMVRDGVVELVDDQNAANLRVVRGRKTHFLGPSKPQISFTSHSLESMEDREGRDEIIIFLEMSKIPKNMVDSEEDAKCLDVHLSLLVEGDEGEEFEVNEGCMRYACGNPFARQQLLRAIWLPPPHPPTKNQEGSPFWSDSFCINAETVRKYAYGGRSVSLLVSVHQRGARHEDYPVGSQKILLAHDGIFEDNIVYYNTERYYHLNRAEAIEEVSSFVDIFLHDMGMEDGDPSFDHETCHTEIKCRGRLISSKYSIDKELNSRFDLSKMEMRDDGKIVSTARFTKPLRTPSFTSTNFEEVGNFALEIMSGAMKQTFAFKKTILTDDDAALLSVPESFNVLLLLCAASKYGNIKDASKKIFQAIEVTKSGFKSISSYLNKRGVVRADVDHASEAPVLLKYLQRTCDDLCKSRFWNIILKIQGDSASTSHVPPNTLKRFKGLECRYPIDAKGDEGDLVMTENHRWPSNLVDSHGYPEAIRMGWPCLLELVVAALSGDTTGIDLMTSDNFISQVSETFESLGRVLAPYALHETHCKEILKSYMDGSCILLEIFLSLSMLPDDSNDSDRKAIEEAAMHVDTPIYAALLSFFKGIMKSIKPGDLSVLGGVRYWLDDPFVNHVVPRCRQSFVNIIFDFLKSHPLDADKCKSAKDLADCYFLHKTVLKSITETKWRDLFQDDRSLFFSIVEFICSSMRSTPNAFLTKSIYRETVRHILYVFVDSNAFEHIEMYCELGMRYVSIARSSYGPMQVEDIVCIKAFYHSVLGFSRMPIAAATLDSPSKPGHIRIATPGEEDCQWFLKMAVLCGDIDRAGRESAFSCLQARLQAWINYFESFHRNELKDAFLEHFEASFSSLPEKFSSAFVNLFRSSQYTTWFKAWSVHKNLENLRDSLPENFAEKIPFQACLLICEYFGLLWVRNIDLQVPLQKRQLLKSLFKHSARRWKVISEPLDVAEKWCKAFPFWEEEKVKRSSASSKKGQNKAPEKRKKYSPEREALGGSMKEVRQGKESEGEEEEGDEITPLVSSMRSSFASQSSRHSSRSSTINPLGAAIAAEEKTARQSTVNPLAAALGAQKKPSRQSTVNPLAAAMNASRKPARESTVNPLAAAMNASRKPARESTVNPLAAALGKKRSTRSSSKAGRKSIMRALSNSSPKSLAKKRNSSLVYQPPPQPRKNVIKSPVKKGLSPAMKYARKMSVFLGPEDAEELFTAVVEAKHCRIECNIMDSSGQVDVVADITPEILKIVSVSDDGTDGKVHREVPMATVTDVQESPAPYVLMVFTSTGETIYLTCKQRGKLVGAIKGLKGGR